MTKGQKFFQEHMAYIAQGNMEGMVNNTFTEDSVLYHNFPFFEGPPPYIAKGKKEIIKAEKIIFDPKNQGKIEASEPFNFVESDDLIGFQIIVISPNTGKWIVTDVWTLSNGKIKNYYAMGYKL